MASDLFSRNVGDLQVSAMAQSLQAPVQKIIETKSKSTEASIDQLSKNLSAFMRKFDPKAINELASAKKWTQAAITMFNNLKSGRGGSGSSKPTKNEEKIEKAAEKMAQATQKIWSASQKQNTFWVGIGKLSNRAQKDIANAIRMSGCCGGTTKALASGAAAAAKRAAGGKGGRGGGRGVMLEAIGGGGGGGGAGAAGAFTSKMGAALSISTALLGAIAGMHSHLVRMVDLDPFQHIFAGAIKDSNAFRENMRQILHQTQGFTKENRAAEKSFFNITQSVLASGVRAGEFHKTYLKNLERGFEIESASDKQWKKQFPKEMRGEKMREMQNKRVLSIQTTALHTATQLGMQTDAINELFMDWHMHLGLSAESIGGIGRHMEFIAKTTGVTGSRLEAAAKSADRVMRSLQSAGLATSAATRNVLGLSASMEKYGVGQQGAEMMGALGSRRGFFQATPEMRSMLTRIAGQTGDPTMINSVMSGAVLQSRGRTAQFAGGMDKEAMRVFGNFRGDLQRLGVAMPKTASDMTAAIQALMLKGPEGERIAGILDQQFANAFGGKGIGEIEQMFKALSEAGKTSGQRITEMNDRLAEMRAKGMEGLDQYKQLQRQLMEAQTAQSMDAFAVLREQLKAGGGKLTDDVKQATIRALTDTMGPEAAQAFVGDLTGAAGNLLKDLGERAKAQGMDLNKLLADRGIKNIDEFQQRLAQGDESAYLALQEATQEMAKRERTAQDPVTDIRRILTDWNTKLVGKIVEMSTGIGDVATRIMYVGGMIAGLLTEILIAVSAFKLISGLLGGGKALGGLGGMLGMGGLRAAAGVAGKAAGPLALGLGGVMGYMGAEEAGRTKGEGTLLGALTGGAGTGSMFSSLFGIEKGGAGDKAMGVAGAGLWGAGIGASIGALLAPLTGGLSLAIGPVVGGLIGAGMEIIKILTEGTDILQKYLIDPLIWVGKVAFAPLIAGAKFVYAVFTGDFRGALEAITEYFLRWPQLLWNMIMRFGPVLLNTLMNIPSYLFQALKAVFVTFPQWLYKTIIDGLKSLATNEIFGPIFQPILELFEFLQNEFQPVWQALGEAFDELSKAWDEITAPIKEAITSLFGAGEGFSLVKTVVDALVPVIRFGAEIIGFFIRGFVDAFKLVYNTIKDVIGWFQWLFQMLVGGSIIPDLVEAIVQFFLTLPLRILSGLADLGIGIVKAIGDFLWNGINTMFGGIPQQIYDSLVAGLNQVKEWLMSWIPGLQSVAAGFSETNEQAAARIEQEGSSILHGAGRAAGGAWDVVTGGEQGGLAGRWEGAKKVAGGAWEGTKAVASAINPLNWFQEGTREIQQPGLGLLHAGEMIMPKSIWESIKAIGKGTFRRGDANVMNMGAFEKGEAGSAMDSGVFGYVKSLATNFADTMLGGPGESGSLLSSLTKAFSSNSAKTGIASQMGAGLFDPNSNIFEAVSESISTMVSKVSDSNIGRFISEALGFKKSDKVDNVVSDVARSMMYDQTASEAAERTMMGEISSNMLDYRDSMRGEVSSSNLSRAAIESTLERDKYGEGTTGSAVVPSMEAIADYLTSTQVDRLDHMITILEEIERNTSPPAGGFSKVIGKISQGFFPPVMPGIKSIARDLTRGFWDLTYGDASPGSVTTEGRGGSG